MRSDLLPTTWQGKADRFVEEVGECLKALGKLGRFGHSATDPLTGISYDNRGDLLSELDDLEHATKALRAHLLKDPNDE